jgi:hypothetical protein
MLSRPVKNLRDSRWELREEEEQAQKKQQSEEEAKKQAEVTGRVTWSVAPYAESPSEKALC